VPLVFVFALQLLQRLAGAQQSDTTSGENAFLISLMTSIPVRRDLAMTGEITLRGRVWPITGLKEKLLAALRGGIKTVLIPEENAKDVVEIADSIKSGLEIIPVSRMDEVLARAMMRKPEPIEWDETTTTAAAVREEAPVEEEASTLTAH
jgi:ATP-dependent Lon protease